MRLRNASKESERVRKKPPQTRRRPGTRPERTFALQCFAADALAQVGKAQKVGHHLVLQRLLLLAHGKPERLGRHNDTKEAQEIGEVRCHRLENVGVRSGLEIVARLEVHVGRANEVTRRLEGCALQEA